MTTTTTTPEQELHEARQEREALEARLRAGDTTITAADLAAVDALIRFAELGIEAAAKRADDERRRARDERVPELLREIQTTAADDALTKAHARMVKAIDTYAAEAVRVTAQHVELYREAQQLKPDGWGFSPWGGKMSTPAGNYRKPDPEQAIIDATRDALKAHGHRDDIRIKKG